MNPFDPYSDSIKTKIGKRILCLISKWNPQKYWRRREYVINPEKKNTLKKLYYLWYIKKIDSYHNCSFATNINRGAIFLSPPNLPHGPNGIIVGYRTRIGRNCCIYQQVTIASGCSVGDDCMFGAGAKMISGLQMGDRVRVGTNAVVIEDIPSDSTVVLPKPRIIRHHLNA